ncbi:hypothetical protein NBH00_01980 [Paraconexibacter antarcticus]|uniref:Acyl-CoA carboxylase epsilon subunit-like protein n=1 Tax=Paraconexibacter antarcticus TaxID=2949664 RepID=A0ABY5DVA1_9ACTN|nr:hypothetical protein [Paraconexibacter antarcticus]UTI64987.1 hypothetical protein NBH00_01980 [Paraconexibacter antarcticus]
MPNRRPQLEMVVSTAATDAEAAAVLAAVEQFLRETMPAAAPAEERQDPWLRAALLEQTGREPDGPTEWGDAHPW